MNKHIVVSLLLLYCTHSFAQENSFDLRNFSFRTDTTVKTEKVFDFFRQEYDSSVYVIGSVFLMPSDSLSFKVNNNYIIKVSNPKNGQLEIYFKDRLLYKYTLRDYEINGTGFC
ncbi:MAG TPA: hypothetical protein V6C58_00615, partial [Allocoleopsis sp.]